MLGLVVENFMFIVQQEEENITEQHTLKRKQKRYKKT